MNNYLNQSDISPEASNTIEFNTYKYRCYEKFIYTREELRDLNLYFSDRITEYVLTHKIKLWTHNKTRVASIPKVKEILLAEQFKLTNPIDIPTAKEMLIMQMDTIWNGTFDYKKVLDNPHIPTHSRLHGVSRYQRKYESIDQWLTLTNIRKNDLIKFCSEEGILAKFDKINKPIIELNSTAYKEMKIKEKQKSGIPLDQRKMPTSRIARLAIEIAFDIESRTNKNVKTREVWNALRRLVDENVYPKILKNKDTDLIYWINTNDIVSTYNESSCAKALQRWRNGDSPKASRESVTIAKL